ncbi:hypothetical protein PAXINDRAFT_172229 [Paxillus involutus ATCC 200175]|uniref:Uncharacterized protein n=1 Tax=Paxillus involutus ATCC 200175 TaxID=664439 RepID=A0A0C9T3M7_PAXIN|nr:hypothetical protein PAXINDRAFT_172229 [Paxillus involutus ATCC 200175]
MRRESRALRRTTIRWSRIPASKASLLLHRSAQLLKITETCSKVDDDNGEDDDDHRAHVVPQHPESTRQTAVNETADTSNPNATSARPTVPVGKSNGPSDDESDEGVKETKPVNHYPRARRSRGRKVTRLSDRAGAFTKQPRTTTTILH